MIYNYYTLECPLSKMIIYVGVTKQPLPIRLRGHLNYSKISNSTLSKYIRSKKIVPVIELIERVNVKNKFFVERYWIEQFRQWGFKLMNSQHNKQKISVRCALVSTPVNVRISVPGHKIIKAFIDNNPQYNLGGFVEMAALKEVQLLSTQGI